MMFRKIFPWLLPLLLAIPAIVPIVTPGYFPIHDDTQVVRVYEMAQALKDGQFPVRWVKDLGYGYGYPIFNFYNPLPYYFGGFFNIIGVDALAATKIIFAFPVLLGAFAMYLLTRKYFGHLAALVSSAFYTYAPYHGIQIYVRGAVAEYWAYAFLPLIIYFLWQKKTLWAGICLALLVLSHNLSVIIFSFALILSFCIDFFTSSTPKAKLFKHYLLAGLIGLGLSAFFWLPSLAEKSFTSVELMLAKEFNPLDHFVYLDQLWRWNWGYGGSAPGRADGLSFIIGKFHLVLTGLGILLFAKFIHRQTKLKNILVLSLISFAFSIFMMLALSRPLWQNLHILTYLQFPWRYLALTAVATAIISGYTVLTLTNQAPKKISYQLKAASVWAFLIIFVTFSTKYFLPKYKFALDVNSASLLNPTRIGYEVSHRSDEYRPTGAAVPESELFLPRGRYEAELGAGETISVTTDKSQILKLATNLSREKTVMLNIYNFPGWQTYLDGQLFSHQSSTDRQLISVLIPAGTHQLSARLANTPVRLIANLISLISLVTLSVMLIKKPQLIS